MSVLKTASAASLLARTAYLDRISSSAVGKNNYAWLALAAWHALQALRIRKGFDVEVDGLVGSELSFSPNKEYSPGIVSLAHGAKAVRSDMDSYSVIIRNRNSRVCGNAVWKGRDGGHEALNVQGSGWRKVFKRRSRAERGWKGLISSTWIKADQLTNEVQQPAIDEIYTSSVMSWVGNGCGSGPACCAHLPFHEIHSHAYLLP